MCYLIVLMPPDDVQCWECLTIWMPQKASANQSALRGWQDMVDPITCSWCCCCCCCCWWAAEPATMALLAMETAAATARSIVDSWWCSTVLKRQRGHEIVANSTSWVRILPLFHSTYGTKIDWGQKMSWWRLKKHSSFTLHCTSLAVSGSNPGTNIWLYSQCSTKNGPNRKTSCMFFNCYSESQSLEPLVSGLTGMSNNHKSPSC